MSSTRIPEMDSAAPKFRALVVLPTPPLLLMIAMVLYYSLLKSFNNSASCDIMLQGDENGNQVCYHSGTKGRN